MLRSPAFLPALPLVGCGAATGGGVCLPRMRDPSGERRCGRRRVYPVGGGILDRSVPHRDGQPGTGDPDSQQHDRDR